MDPVQEAIDLTQRLVQLPSESSGWTLSDVACPEGRVEEFLIHVLKQSGLHPFTIKAKGERRNVLARFPGDGPRLLLVGHMDTVSGLDMENPFGGTVHDGRIWGRGACDDKGPLAAAVAVLRWMQEQKRKSYFDIIFAATSDEECSLSGAEALANYIDSVDLCLALEPTGLKIVCGHKGDIRLKITTSGRAVHSSMPDQGDNAVEKLFSIASELEKYKKRFADLPQSEFFGRPTYTVTSVHGGSSSNIVPDTCSMTVDIRLLPDMDPQEMLDKIEAVVGSRAQIDLLFAGSGMRTDYRHPCVQRLAGILKAHKEDPAPSWVSYATDCCRLAAKGPCIVWGPGNIAQAHNREEFIAIDALTKAVHIMKNFLCTA